MHTPLDTTRGKLLQQFVLARITSLDEVNVAHFDFDRHNSLFYFIINSDEDIYLRYGGRDSESQNTYLDLNSFEKALKIGLSQHKKFLTNPPTSKRQKKQRTPEQYRLLNKNVLKSQRCAECHLVADYSTRELSIAGLADPIRHLYRSPNIKKLGIFLDVPKGLVIKNVSGYAKEAGLQAGDEILSIKDKTVHTFADLQYELDKLSRYSKHLELKVKRKNETKKVFIPLPKSWWVTDLTFRHWSTEPQEYFWSTPLTDQEKKKLNLPQDGFAARVTKIGFEAKIRDTHSLEIDDIITAVNGVRIDPLCNDLHTHFNLHYQTGSTANLTVLRNNKSLKVNILFGTNTFRKGEADIIPEDLKLKWPKATAFEQDGTIILKSQAIIANGHLLIKLKHHPSWATYSLPLKSNSNTITQFDLGQIKPSGKWLQTEPLNERGAIHPVQKGITYYAIKLNVIPEGENNISFSTKAIHDNGTELKKHITLQLPIVINSHENIAVSDLLMSLTPSK